MRTKKKKSLTWSRVDLDMGYVQEKPDVTQWINNNNPTNIFIAHNFFLSTCVICMKEKSSRHIVTVFLGPGSAGNK